MNTNTEQVIDNTNQLINNYFNLLRTNQTLLQDIGFYTYKTNCEAGRILQTHLYHLTNINEREQNEQQHNERRQNERQETQQTNTLYNRRNSINTGNSQNTRTTTSTETTPLEELLVELLSDTLNNSLQQNNLQQQNLTHRRHRVVHSPPRNRTVQRNTLNQQTPINPNSAFNFVPRSITRPNNRIQTNNMSHMNDASNTPLNIRAPERTRLFANTESIDSPWNIRSSINNSISENINNGGSNNENSSMGLTNAEPRNTENVIFDSQTSLSNIRLENPVRRRRRRTPYRLMQTTFISAPPPRTTGNFDSPHRIRPSIRQINQATQILTFSDISQNHQRHCPIDLNDFEDNDSILRIIPCQHIFREMNLRNHFRYSPRCPICRYDIRDYQDLVSNININQINTQENTRENTQENTRENREENNIQNNTENNINTTDYNVWPPV